MYERSIGYDTAIRVIEKWIKEYKIAYLYSRDKNLKLTIANWQKLLEIVKASKNETR